MAILYAVKSKEVYLLFNFLFLQIMNLFVFLFIFDSLIKFQNIFLVVLVFASILLSFKVIKSYDSLPKLNSP